MDHKNRRRVQAGLQRPLAPNCGRCTSGARTTSAFIGGRARASFEQLMTEA